jgi:cysteine/O-acetylserine efflux protein
VDAISTGRGVSSSDRPRLLDPKALEMPNPLAYLTYVLLTSFTPGPNNIMAMSNASRVGFRRSLKFNAGVFAGFFAVTGLACAFSLTLQSVMPGIKPVMTVIGAAYILWLAWKTAFPRSHADGAVPGSGTFVSGMLLQFVNPKALLYGLTVASTFLVPYYHSPVVLGAFCLFMAGVSFVSTSSWALFGSVFERFLAGNAKTVGFVMAALLVYCAVSLFL